VSDLTHIIERVLFVHHSKNVLDDVG
jgi:hypothetical protein